MKEQTLELEIHDQPDVLVRIVEIVHRRGGHVRELKITPGKPWAEMRATVQGVDNLTQTARSLEKLFDVRRARFTTSV